MTIRSTTRVLLAAALMMSAASAWAAAAAPTGTAASAPVAGHSTPAKRKPAPPARKLVDINSAGVAELKTLPGIGDAEAQAIVAGRPYKTKADLVYKKVLPEGPYVSVRRHIIAVQKAPPKSKPPKAKAA